VAGTEYVADYIIEKSLSVDNPFVLVISRVVVRNVVPGRRPDVIRTSGHGVVADPGRVIHRMFPSKVAGSMVPEGATMPHDVVDAHHHLWVRARAPQDWIDPVTMAAIDADFTPADLPAAAHGVAATVVVQSANLWSESRELLTIAASDRGRAARIRGVVAWADLLGPGVGDHVAALREGPGGSALVGLRTQVQAEPDPDYLDRADVRRGIAEACSARPARPAGTAGSAGAAGSGGLVFDLVIRADQLPAAARLAAALPEVSFVLDHLGKPRLDARTAARTDARPGTGLAPALAAWREDLTELAARPNVTAKLSGLVTEARWDDWQPDDLRPAVDHALEVFGPERLMFGSDWPVCLLATDYGGWMATLGGLLGGLSPDESAAVWAGTARRVYHLGHAHDLEESHG
jgi:L-fuconolactonase